MSDTLISVIMPVFNGERYIDAALRSLLREKGLALDIIVIDDGSTDRTAEIVSHIASTNPQIRLISGPHAGVSQARNIGLGVVPTDAAYITFLDSDDLNAPGRIKRQLKIIKESPDCECVIGLIQFFESADEEKGLPLPGSKSVTVTGIQLAAALFSRSIFDQFGGFNEDMQHGEDTDLFLRILESQVNYFMEDKVAVLYRRHSANMTNDIAKTRRGFMAAIRRSLGRRSKDGTVVDLGDLFKNRSTAEEIFRNG